MNRFCWHLSAVPGVGPHYVSPIYCDRVRQAIDFYHTQPGRIPEPMPLPYPKACCPAWGTLTQTGNVLVRAVDAYCPDCISKLKKMAAAGPTIGMMGLNGQALVFSPNTHNYGGFEMGSPISERTLDSVTEQLHAVGFGPDAGTRLEEGTYEWLVSKLRQSKSKNLLTTHANMLAVGKEKNAVSTNISKSKPMPGPIIISTPDFLLHANNASSVTQDVKSPAFTPEAQYTVSPLLLTTTKQFLSAKELSAADLFPKLPAACAQVWERMRIEGRNGCKELMTQGLCKPLTSH